MRYFEQVAIIGVGLIGGSIGLGIKNKKMAKEVIGIGHHRKSINGAIKVKAIDRGYLDIKEVRNADLVVLASPVRTIVDILPRLPGLIKKGCIVIDVGSTKAEVLRVANRLDMDFVGCHPLAGMEKKGPENAKGCIFNNSLCILVPAKNAKKVAVQTVSKLWMGLGAKVKIISAAKHDRILAFVSHLPHAVVFSLMDSIDKDCLGFAAGGLRGTTRIGLSDPLSWRDIFLTNKKELMGAIKRFKISLARLEYLIKKNQPENLSAYLNKVRNKRNVFRP